MLYTLVQPFTIQIQIQNVTVKSSNLIMLEIVPTKGSKATCPVYTHNSSCLLCIILPDHLLYLFFKLCIFEWLVLKHEMRQIVWYVI